jgi:hypothetical protein
MKPSSPVLQSARLLDQLRECLHFNYYSFNTEKYYVYWVIFFVRWTGRGVALLAGIIKPVSVYTLRMSEAIFVGRAIAPADLENASGYKAHIPLSAVFSKPAALQSSMY